MSDVEEPITRAYRDEWARVVAGLTGRSGILDFAEEAAVDAFATAVARWPADGVRPNPGAWLTTTARDRPAGNTAETASLTRRRDQLWSPDAALSRRPCARTPRRASRSRE